MRLEGLPFSLECVCAVCSSVGKVRASGCARVDCFPVLTFLTQLLGGCSEINLIFYSHAKAFQSMNQHHVTGLMQQHRRLLFKQQGRDGFELHPEK